MSADQIGDALRRALVGNEVHVHAGRCHEQFGAEMRTGALRRGADIDLAGSRLRRSDQVGDRFVGRRGCVMNAIGITAIRPMASKSLRMS